MRQKRENGGGAMKLYFTDYTASIGVCETHTCISMNIGGKIVSISIPNNDLKIHELSEDFRMGDTLADWLARNGKEV